jgi:hypothetical protein
MSRFSSNPPIASQAHDRHDSAEPGARPSTGKVGTVAWVQDTRGWLSASERRALLRPLAAAHVRNVVGRTRLALHLHTGRHAHIAPERLEPPRTVLARRAEEAAARRLPPVLLHHSRRTFRFGLALGVVAGTEVDEELLYAAAMLHDTGLLTSSGDADFTLQSARVAHEVAEQVGLSQEATTIVLDAITLHHSPGVGPAHGAVAQLLSVGAAADVTGLYTWRLPDSVLTEAVTLYPREAFKDVFTNAFRNEAARVPEGRARFLHRYGAFAAAIRLAPFAE